MYYGVEDQVALTDEDVFKEAGLRVGDICKPTTHCLLWLLEDGDFAIEGRGQWSSIR